MISYSYWYIMLSSLKLSIDMEAATMGHLVFGEGGGD